MSIHCTRGVAHPTVTSAKSSCVGSKAVILDEANRVIQTGLDMIDTIQEFKE